MRHYRLVLLMKRSWYVFKKEGFLVLLSKAINRLSLFSFTYRWWIKNEEKKMFASPFLSYTPKISILLPVYKTRLSFLREAILSVDQQIYPHWELCIVDDGSNDVRIKEYLSSLHDSRIKISYLDKNEGTSEASNKAFALSTGDFIALLDHDDKLSPYALREIAQLLNNNRSIDFIYSDEDRITEKGKRYGPMFKPDWSPDLLYSCMYICHLSVYRRSILKKAGLFRKKFDGAQDYDLALRVSELTKKIFHIPKILYHWRIHKGQISHNFNSTHKCTLMGRDALLEKLKRKNEDGDVAILYQGQYRIQRKILGNPLVSIIILSKDYSLLNACLKSIFSKTDYNHYEILIVVNNTDRKRELEIQQKNVRYFYKTEKFNFSTLNNYAVRHAYGEFLLFLNDDTIVLNNEWLVAMLEHAQRREVGCVGCKLLYPDGSIQHAGVIVGTENLAFHINRQTWVYNTYANLIRNFSAVTAACLLIKKSLFLQIGKFDESFPYGFGDIDLCLRIRKKGYLIVYTPFAMLFHYESKTRGYENSIEKIYDIGRENLLKKWPMHPSYEDPYFNANFRSYNLARLQWCSFMGNKK